MLDSRVCCVWCGNPTSHQSDEMPPKECSGCWELVTRIRHAKLPLLMRIISAVRTDVDGICDCGHTWGDHTYDAAGNELPDAGPCRLCDCEAFK